MDPNSLRSSLFAAKILPPSITYQSFQLEIFQLIVNVRLFKNVENSFIGKNSINNHFSILGGLAVAVPGELRGLEAAWKKYGKLPWEELFKPAIRIAKKGFIIPETVDIAIGIWKNLLMKDKTFR